MGESGMSTKAKAVRIAAGSGAVLSLGASLIATAGPAGAATFNVTTTADAGAGSLRQAILDADATAGPDTITFQAGLGTIGLTGGHMLVTDDLTITDPEADVTIDADDSGRDLLPRHRRRGDPQRPHPHGGNGTIGRTAAAIVSVGHRPHHRRQHHHRQLSPSTAAASAAGAGSLTVTDSTFTGNESVRLRRRHHRPGRSTLGHHHRLHVHGQPSSDGDGGGGASFDNIADVSIADTTFTGNTADDYGGGLVVEDATSVTISGSTFDDNTADRAAASAPASTTPRRHHRRLHRSAATPPTTPGGGLYLADLDQSTRHDRHEHVRRQRAESTGLTAAASPPTTSARVTVSRVDRLEQHRSSRGRPHRPGHRRSP